MNNQHRFETEAEAVARAAALTEATGNLHISYKSDYACAPWMAAALPKVGDKVSKSFNGDSYPEGEIIRISPTYSTITTSTGCRFTRVAPMRWKEGGQQGGFTLIQGHHDERNPHF